MSESPQIHFLSKNEFITFVLIYASHIDYEFTPHEKALILNKTDNQTFNTMMNLFEKNNDYQCMKIILKHKSKYFNNKRDQDQLFGLIKELFEADNDYSRIEQTFIPFFKKMIEAQID